MHQNNGVFKKLIIVWSLQKGDKNPLLTPSAAWLRAKEAYSYCKYNEVNVEFIDKCDNCGWGIPVGKFEKLFR